MKMMSDPITPEAVVIGLGNPLMGDDGLGITALERLRDEWQFEPHVEFVDGGTWGMNLLPFVEGARHVIVLDAIHTGGPPGRYIELQRDDLPRYFSTKISPHQIDFREVLALAELRGTLPQHIVAVGLEPKTVTMTTSLSDEVHEGLPAVIQGTVYQLLDWGYRAHSRSKTNHA
jgi:hydrogenase maturation protease